MNAVGLVLLKWLAAVLAVNGVILAGCNWQRSTTGDSLNVSTSNFTDPIMDGFTDTFGPDGAVPLWRPEAERVPVPSSQVEFADRLTLTAYVDDVSRLNPTVEAAEATWLSIRERYPQVTAFEDTQFRFLNGPTLFGSNSGAHLWRIQAQQPISGWGKRRWRGRVAEQQAVAAREEFHMVQQQLRETASQVYFDYALIESIRPLVEAEHRLAEKEIVAKKVRLISSNSEEIGREEQLQLDRIELDQSIDEFRWTRRETIRRANLLLGRGPDAPLPPPDPPRMNTIDWNETELFENIAAWHPELARADALCREAEAQVQLARRQYYPDFVLVSRFDTNADQFWLPERAFVRPQLGFNVYLPLQKSRLEAGVRQAEANLRRRQAERRLVERKLREDVAQSVEALQRLHHNMNRLASLSSIAERRKRAVKVASGVQFTSSTDYLQARRQWLKYEIERVRAEFAWRQKLVELTGQLEPEPSPVPPHMHSPAPDQPYDVVPPPHEPPSAHPTDPPPAPRIAEEFQPHGFVPTYPTHEPPPRTEERFMPHF